MTAPEPGGTPGTPGTEATSCEHAVILAWRFDDPTHETFGRIAMWGCQSCRLRFEPRAEAARSERERIVARVIEAMPGHAGWHLATEDGIDRAAVLALLRDEQEDVRRPNQGTTDAQSAVCYAEGYTGSPCQPRGHRYDRVGTTDVIRCRRCGFERAG